jgi:hypothetical protein
MDITTNQVILGACITASVALIVGIITAYLTFKSNALSRKNEHKLAILKVLLEAAYKEYEFRTKQDLEEAKLQGKIAKIKSFTEYIIFYREIADIFSNQTVSSDDIISSLKKNKVLIDTYYINREKEKPEYHKVS